jgi:hypothetical protein
MADSDPDDSGYLGSMSARKAHDQLVLALINETVESLSVHSVQQKYAVIGVLGLCHAAMTNKRYEDVMNTVVRDAEYYFVAREGVATHKWRAAKDFSEAFQDMRAAWYDLFKQWTNPINRKNGSHLLQSQDHKPNSPAGGSRWAFQGSNDGQLDDPNAIAKPKLCVYTPYDSEREAQLSVGDFGDVPPDDLAP